MIEFESLDLTGIGLKRLTIRTRTIRTIRTRTRTIRTRTRTIEQEEEQNCEGPLSLCEHFLHEVRGP